MTEQQNGNSVLNRDNYEMLQRERDRLGTYLNFWWNVGKITRSYFPEPWMNDDVICPEGGGGGRKAWNTTKEGRLHDCGCRSGQKGKPDQSDVSHSGSRGAEWWGHGRVVVQGDTTQQGADRVQDQVWVQGARGEGELYSFTRKQKPTFLTPFKPTPSSSEQWRA